MFVLCASHSARGALGLLWSGFLQMIRLYENCVRMSYSLGIALLDIIYCFCSHNSNEYLNFFKHIGLLNLCSQLFGIYLDKYFW